MCLSLRFFLLEFVLLVTFFLFILPIDYVSGIFYDIAFAMPRMLVVFSLLSESRLNIDDTINCDVTAKYSEARATMEKQQKKM